MADEALPRQFVNFSFYRVDPLWRRLPQAERDRGRAEFIEVVQQYSKKLILLNYSLAGIRPDCDFMLWRIGFELELFQEMSARLNQTGLGHYLTTPYSYLAVTKRSVYIDKHVHPGQEGRRGQIKPGEGKYLFVYPFVKTRDWYQLPFPERQKMMDVHIAVGHKYPSIRINTTYSFGIDDQEFVVAFDGDDPREFVDLVQELREAASSKYTVRDTPAFTCVRKNSTQEVLDLL
ncbi:MAG: chlorite dismutase family protein [Deltaproteobacteria bacterium]|nr:chlorite dismutase family protein [Deltaproteobacteria bacterium]